MADSTPPGQPPEASGMPLDRDRSRAEVGGNFPAPGVDRWLENWRRRLEADQGLPDDEARIVVRAILDDQAGGPPENLDLAGRAWGRVHRSVSAMVGRLSSFREALAAGGVDDPLRMHRTLDRITASATEEVLHRLERASRTDALTGVGNRRAFDETLSAALSAASRQGHDVTVVAVDLDGLKRINDTEGHAAGDAALLALVRAFYSGLRDEDLVFRVGGDEFVILLPFTAVDAAAVLMERIQDSGAPAFTWGAAGFPGDGADAGGLVEAADQEMLRRREEDRRVVVVAPARAFSKARRDPSRRIGRWAWASAAAAVVLLASLLAAFLPSSAPHRSVSAGRGSGPLASGPPPTADTGGRTGSSPTPGRGGRPETAASGGGAPAMSLGYSSALSNSSGPPSGSTPPGTSPPPGSPAPPPAQRGLLGALEELLTPVPLVGGSNGLLSTVGGVLTGPQNASTGGSVPASGPSGMSTTTEVTPATSSLAGARSGLLGVVNRLLG